MECVCVCVRVRVYVYVMYRFLKSMLVEGQKMNISLFSRSMIWINFAFATEGFVIARIKHAARSPCQWKGLHIDQVFNRTRTSVVRCLILKSFMLD